MFIYQFADPALNGAITTRVVIGHGILLDTSTVLTTGYTNSLIQSDGPIYVHISVSYLVLSQFIKTCSKFYHEHK